MDHTAQPLPNEPARVRVESGPGRIRISYAGRTIASIGVKVKRGEDLLDPKTAGVRLIAVSKHTGWDRIVQTIRLGAVATKPGDLLSIRGTVGAAESDTHDAVPARLDDGVFHLDTLACGLEWSPSVDADPGSNPIAIQSEASEFLVIFKPLINALK